MSVQIDKLKQDINKSLNDASKPWYGLFTWIEGKSGVPRIYVFLACVGFIGLYLMFGYAAQLLCNFIGIAYPAYVSIHAIETSTKDDDTKWLVYWVTFACLTLTEHFSVFLCSCVPFYYLLKCIFLVWCMLPIQNNGSAIIYRRIILPHFLKHHKSVDKLVHDVSENIKKSVEDVLKKD